MMKIFKLVERFKNSEKIPEKAYNGLGIENPHLYRYFYLIGKPLKEFETHYKFLDQFKILLDTEVAKYDYYGTGAIVHKVHMDEGRSNFVFRIKKGDVEEFLNACDKCAIDRDDIHQEYENYFNELRKDFERIDEVKEKLCWDIWYDSNNKMYDSYKYEIEDTRNWLNGAWFIFKKTNTF